MIEDSINYGDVASSFVEYTKTHIVKLLETAAEELAEAMLSGYDMAKGKPFVEIKKPRAPIGLPSREASVKIERLAIMLT